MAEKGRRRRAELAAALAWCRNNAPIAMAALYLAMLTLALPLLLLLAH